MHGWAGGLAYPSSSLLGERGTQNQRGESGIKGRCALFPQPKNPTTRHGTGTAALRAKTSDHDRLKARTFSSKPGPRVRSFLHSLARLRAISGLTTYDVDSEVGLHSPVTLACPALRNEDVAAEGRPFRTLHGLLMPGATPTPNAWADSGAISAARAAIAAAAPHVAPPLAKKTILFVVVRFSLFVFKLPLAFSCFVFCSPFFLATPFPPLLVQI